MKTISYFTLMLFIALSVTSCKKITDMVEPKGFIEKFYDQTLDLEWVVDSIRYTTYDESQNLISDDIKPVGKMVFKKPINVENDPILYLQQGYMIHTYERGGASAIDTMAYSLNNSGTEIKYLDITSKPANVASFKGIASVTFDIEQLDNHTYNLYRYEHLQDKGTGQWQGYLRRVIKMHR